VGKRRKRGFCLMCRPFTAIYRLRGMKVPLYDDSCRFCGGWGEIPYRWKKGDRDRRGGVERRSKP
jgi:hypothetical protein